jgi:M6 family metalloprotease-like protein
VRKLLVTAVIGSLLVAGFTAPAQAAAPKAGAACAKAGITQVVKAGTKSTKFTCVKSGKKLVWNKGVVTIAKPAPAPQPSTEPTVAPTPTPTPTPTAMPFDSTKPKQGDPCPRNSGDVIGYNNAKVLVWMMCNNWDDRYFPREGAAEIDQLTGKEKVSLIAPDKTFFSANFGLYVYNTGDVGAPTGAITEASALSKIDLCKVQQGDPMLTNFSSGFPIKPERMSLTNSPTIQFITVDFAGHRANTKPKDDLKDVTDALSTFYKNQATKPVNLDLRIPADYVDMPKTVEEYGLDVNFFAGGFTGKARDNYFDYLRAAIKLVDKDIDFTGVEAIVLASPPGIKNKQIGVFVAEAAIPGQGYQTDEGTIHNALIRGNDEIRDLDNWTHEFGHMLGLTDIRNTLDKGNQKSDGMGYFDLMANQNLPELLVWHRFLLGILNDDQIRCVTKQASTTHWLSPVAAITDKPKGVVIPLSSTTAIIIESRRHLGFDINMGKNTEGALVYKLDTTVRYGLSPVKIIYPARSVDRDWETDSTLRLGESVTSDGWKITVTETGKFGDVVKVEKVG